VEVINLEEKEPRGRRRAGVATGSDAKEASRGDDDNDEGICWIKAPSREHLFTTPLTWWMVDLQAQPAPDQGATPLVRRCVRALGWSEAKARSVLSAYRQFLHVKKMKKDWNATLLSPSVAVDQMWHQHILDSNNYPHDCAILCGRFVGHNPDGASDGPAKAERLKATKEALLECYGEYGIDRSESGPWSEVFCDAETTQQTPDPPSVTSDEPITIFFRGIDDAESLYLRVKPKTPMERVFKKYAEQLGLEMTSLRFFLDGERLDSGCTPRMMEMEDGDVIDVGKEQLAC
jgi:hypothetical protein